MEKDMTKGSPTKLILWFTIPLLIGNVFQQLYSMVDTIIVGKFVGVDQLAAVGLTGPMAFLMLGFVFGLTGGFAVVTAQRFGAKDEDGLRRSVTSAIYLSITITTILTVIAIVTAKPLLRLMNTPEDIFHDAYVYIIIIYAGIGALVFYNLMACILRALGDSKTPLYFLIVSSILNIILDLVFILNLQMGVAGAAFATVISQFISGVLCLIYTAKKYPILHLKKKDWKWDTNLAKKHMYIGLPMAFQFSITAIGVIVLQGALNLLGTEKIAAFTAANKAEQLVAQPAGSFGITMANYAGQNYGASKFNRIREGVKKCSILTTIFAIGAGFILIVFGEPLTTLFVDVKERAVIQAAREYLIIISVCFPALNLLFVYRNVLQGIGRSFMPFMAGVFELVARSAVAFTLPYFIGFTGICLAGPIAWFAAAIPLGITYYKVLYSKEYEEPDDGNSAVQEMEKGI